MYLKKKNFLLLYIVLAEVKVCVEQGAVIKEHCTAAEEEVAGGCSSAHFCCCSPTDGDHHLSVILFQNSYEMIQMMFG